MIVLVSAAAILAVLFLPKLTRAEALASFTDRTEPALRRWGPRGAALVSVAVIWWAWGEVLPIPVIPDEASYLLQAEIFANGRWTVPSPPIPEFFEQPYVLVVPAVASKYPPGHALLLALGALVSFPPLVPLLLTAATAALLFAIVARVVNAWVALLAWIFWLTAPLVLRFQPSYLSELTTAALVLSSWWALLEWRATRRLKWLLILALAVGWGAITRPYTMFLFAIPIGAVVVRDAARLRLWRELGLALAVGAAVLGVLPLWSARTTGDWRLWPQELYRRDYMPFDKPGFRLDSTPPARAASLSPVLVAHNITYFGLARAHTPERLPGIAGLRLTRLAGALFPRERLPLIVLAIAGLTASGALLFAAGSVLLLFLGHLAYPHSFDWLVYYLEAVPVAAALTAAGAWRAARLLARNGRHDTTPAALLALLLSVVSVQRVNAWRGRHLANGEPYRNLGRQTAELRAPAIAFMRYAPGPSWHLPVVWNFVDAAAAPVWLVHDLGARNVELQRLAAGRTAVTILENLLPSHESVGGERGAPPGGGLQH